MGVFYDHVSVDRPLHLFYARIPLHRLPTTGPGMMQDKRRGWPRPWSIARFMVLLCLTAMWWAVGWSAHVPHLQWMSPYRAADGSACCNIADCFKAAVTLLSEPTGEMVRVLVSTVEDTQHQQVLVQTVVIVLDGAFTAVRMRRAGMYEGAFPVVECPG